jgi:hypothetical protein
MTTAIATQKQEFIWKEEIQTSTIFGPQMVCGWVYGDSGLFYHPRINHDKSLSDRWYTISHLLSGKRFKLPTQGFDFAQPVLAMRFIEKVATFTNWNRPIEEIQGEWGAGLCEKCQKLYERLSKGDLPAERVE